MKHFAVAGFVALCAVAMGFMAIGPDSAVAQKKGKRPAPDPEVKEERLYIPRTAWMAAIPGGPKGYTAVLGLMEKDPNFVMPEVPETDPQYTLKRAERIGGKGRDIDCPELIPQLIEQAKSFRDSIIQLAQSPKHNEYMIGVAAVKTEHFELITDINKTSLQKPSTTSNTGGDGSADLYKAAVAYAARAERVWRDYAGIVGEEIASYNGTGKIYLWNKGEPGAKKRNKVLEHVFDYHLSKDHKSGGSNIVGAGRMNVWWSDSIPDDEHLWEHYVHSVAGMLLAGHTGNYGGDQSSYGWLSEGFAFYVTRIHKEHDNCTTMQFDEVYAGTAKHVDGGESGWLSHAQALVKKGLRTPVYKDGVLQPDKAEKMGYYSFKDILNFKVNQMPTDARVQAWAMVKFLVDVYEGGGETARKKFVAFLDAVKNGKEKKVDEEFKEVYDWTMKQWEDEWVIWLKDPKGYEGRLKAKKAAEIAEAEKARKAAEKAAKAAEK